MSRAADVARRSRTNLRRKVSAALGRNSCSQIRITRQPSRRSRRVIVRSRTLLATILEFQKIRRVLGRRPCIGQPCQKHPSTNTNTRLQGKTKSGCPKSLEPRRQPQILSRLKTRIIWSSVLRFPRLRTDAIRAERSEGDKVSAIDSRSGFVDTIWSSSGVEAILCCQRSLETAYCEQCGCPGAARWEATRDESSSGRLRKALAF